MNTKQILSFYRNIVTTGRKLPQQKNKNSTLIFTALPSPHHLVPEKKYFTLLHKVILKQCFNLKLSLNCSPK